MHQRCQLLLAEGELERCHRGVVACHRGVRLLGVPDICQKLRYTQPHVAPRPNPPQRLSPAQLCGHVRSREAL
jgi:hypothetical protein